ncbi:MAG: hypothetical protein LUI60_07320 [Clostridia bacterium]|nr:hypothetical protein [Clostridia bacterium]
MPVITIDGERLISLCVEKEIGFNYKPVFSKNDISNLISPTKEQGTGIPKEYLVDRIITQNDIRARILVIPQVIKDYLGADCHMVEIVINGKDKNLTIDKSRRYFGGVTEIYRQSGCLTEDNIYVSKLSRWKIKDRKIIIDIV